MALRFVVRTDPVSDDTEIEEAAENDAGILGVSHFAEATYAAK